MDDADDLGLDVRSVKRARFEELDSSQINGGSRSTQAAVPANKQPAVHTKALRSVLKGATSPHIQNFFAGDWIQASLTCLL